MTVDFLRPRSTIEYFLEYFVVAVSSDGSGLAVEVIFGFVVIVVVVVVVELFELVAVLSLFLLDVFSTSFVFFLKKGKS